MSTAKIFLSYRRSDSEAETRNIYERLRSAGHTDVFMDRSEIKPGQAWPERIASQLEAADIVIAVIGPSWLTCQEEDGRRRIDNPDDAVHRELRMALHSAKTKTIIPVLVRHAHMPNATSLPHDLMALASHQAKYLTQENWDDALNALVSSIAESKSRATIVLTSTSPRRQQLLRAIGWAEGRDYHSVHASVSLAVTKEKLSLPEARKHAEDTACSKVAWLREHPDEVARKLHHGWSPSHTILVGVDTIVFCNDKILDRPLLKALELAGPQDIAHARPRAKKMLMDECGQTIHIITGLAVATMDSQKHPTTRVVVTEAKLRSYSEQDIDAYIASSAPFDKAGAFGIQEKGVSLFERITGSYTNVVGLPLLEFIALLNSEYKDEFAIPALRSAMAQSAPAHTAHTGAVENNALLSVVCVGDINYDFIYDSLSPGFFTTLMAPGQKIAAPIHRAVGGTAVNFAKGAKTAGFATCYVAGVIGGDALGQHIVSELRNLDIVPIYLHDPTVMSSIAIILRDRADNDVSLTLTDAYQSLPAAALSLAEGPIRESHVVYCSGYCLTDRNRRASALKLLATANRAQALVVLDVVVGMSKEVPLRELETALSEKRTGSVVDVLVSELPEMFDWFGVAADGKDEIETWTQHRETLIAGLRERFSVAILRTSRYTHEIVITPDRVIGPTELDYSLAQPLKKTGYGDFRTARQVHSFLSPRIVLASRSPQRRELLGQIVAPSKIQVVGSTCAEAVRRDETPRDRVQRLALEKATSVLISGAFHDDIELIIGADTEIVRRGEHGQSEMVGHPRDTDEAVTQLRKLINQDHYALTGLAIIGKDATAGTGQLKKVVIYEETKVTVIDASDGELYAYAETGEPIGRAGAYAIQGLGTMLIQGVEGSYSNVVGLPLERLSRILAEEFGKPVWCFDNVSRWCFPDPIKGVSHDTI